MEATQASPSTAVDLLAPENSIAIVVLTNSRLHLLRKCVENVLGSTSPATREIVIWNNASTDGTSGYLDGLTDPRLTIVNHEENIGQNAYARAFELTSSDYLIELDDDVVDAPAHWDATLLHAFKRVPGIGFLAADLEEDPHDLTSRYRHGFDGDDLGRDPDHLTARYREYVRAHEYVPFEENGVRLLRGPAGGYCAMTSRDLYLRVGGFRQDQKQVFWQEEPAYIEDIEALGFGAAVLADLRVHHTGGRHYGVSSPEKDKFWARYWRRRSRRAKAKKIVFSVPFFGRLNSRFGWFEPPS
jgi:GT2 family glycosyltransferase